MHTGGLYPAILMMALGSAHIPDTANSPLATAGTYVMAAAVLTYFHPSTIVDPSAMLMEMGAPRKNGRDMEEGSGMNLAILGGRVSRAMLTRMAKKKRPSMSQNVFLGRTSTPWAPTSA